MHKRVSLGNVGVPIVFEGDKEVFNTRLSRITTFCLGIVFATYCIYALVLWGEETSIKTEVEVYKLSRLLLEEGNSLHGRMFDELKLEVYTPLTDHIQQTIFAAILREAKRLEEDCVIGEIYTYSQGARIFYKHTDFEGTLNWIINGTDDDCYYDTLLCPLGNCNVNHCSFLGNANGTDAPSTRYLVATAFSAIGPMENPALSNTGETPRRPNGHNAQCEGQDDTYWKVIGARFDLNYETVQLSSGEQGYMKTTEGMQMGIHYNQCGGFILKVMPIIIRKYDKFIGSVVMEENTYFHVHSSSFMTKLDPRVQTANSYCIGVEIYYTNSYQQASYKPETLIIVLSKIGGIASIFAVFRVLLTLYNQAKLNQSLEGKALDLGEFNRLLKRMDDIEEIQMFTLTSPPPEYDDFSGKRSSGGDVMPFS